MEPWDYRTLGLSTCDRFLDVPILLVQTCLSVCSQVFDSLIRDHLVNAVGTQSVLTYLLTGILLLS